jgi:transcription antitermination factor NusA-like protein
MSKTTDYTKPPRTMPHMWSFAQQREQRIRILENELRQIGDERVDLILWAREAYTRLNALMSIGVSVTPDAVTKQLLEDAPDSVKGGEQ